MAHQAELIARFLITGQCDGEPVINLAVEVTMSTEPSSIYGGYYRVSAQHDYGTIFYMGSSRDRDTALQMALRVLARGHGFRPGGKQ